MVCADKVRIILETWHFLFHSIQKERDFSQPSNFRRKFFTLSRKTNTTMWNTTNSLNKSPYFYLPLSRRRISVSPLFSPGSSGVGFQIDAAFFFVVFSFFVERVRSRFGFVFRPPSAQEVTLDRSRRGDGFRLVRYVEWGDADGEHARFVAKDDVGEVPVADEDELFARRRRIFLLVFCCTLSILFLLGAVAI